MCGVGGECHMENRLPTHQPANPGCQPHLQVGRFATISPLEALIAKITRSHNPVETAGSEDGARTFGGLADAYRRYWSLPETEPVTTFQAAYRGIAFLEGQASPQVAWRILRQAATNYHTETGICPFCRSAGELHLPPEQPMMELVDP